CAEKSPSAYERAHIKTHALVYDFFFRPVKQPTFVTRSLWGLVWFGDMCWHNFLLFCWYQSCCKLGLDTSPKRRLCIAQMQYPGLPPEGDAMSVAEVAHW